MEPLLLGDFKDLPLEEVKTLIEETYSGQQVSREEIRNCFKSMDILIAFEATDEGGCDSSSWFLLKEKSSNKMFETNGNHCSCFGFEDQWILEETNFDYLLSSRFYSPINTSPDPIVDRIKELAILNGVNVDGNV